MINLWKVGRPHKKSIWKLECPCCVSLCLHKQFSRVSATIKNGVIVASRHANRHEIMNADPVRAQINIVRKPRVFWSFETNFMDTLWGYPKYKMHFGLWQMPVAAYSKSWPFCMQRTARVLTMRLSWSMEFQKYLALTGGFSMYMQRNSNNASALLRDEFQMHACWQFDFLAPRHWQGNCCELMDFDTAVFVDKCICKLDLRLQTNFKIASVVRMSFKMRLRFQMDSNCNLVCRF